jgi:hypothetical protein
MCVCDADEYGPRSANGDEYPARRAFANAHVCLRLADADRHADSDGNATGSD